MKQRTLAMTTGFERYNKKTRRAAFLEEMEQVVQWAELCALIDPHYPKAGNGCPPVGVERMLRIYFLQQWFNLSDPGVEEALYDSVVMRQFAGIDLGQEPVQDETTVCKFRHLLEEHGIGGEILQTVNLYLQDRGVKITTGTIVDATLIHAPSSTRNRGQQRDPEMHQARKGKHWYFGMKAHVGVDSRVVKSCFFSSKTSGVLRHAACWLSLIPQVHHRAMHDTLPRNTATLHHAEVTVLFAVLPESMNFQVHVCWQDARVKAAFTETRSGLQAVLS
jgi:IS5 family transposase